jgi:single-strand DNA-binding protein
MNVVVLRGSLSRPPDERVLDSGTRLVRFEVTTKDPDDRAQTVPVAWIDAPAAAARISSGDEVMVVGQVRRRWFRRGPATESRTEVAASAVVPLRQAKRARAVLAEALSRMERGG